MTYFTAYMIWQPKLPIFWGGLLLIAIFAWAFFLFSRVKRRYSKQKTLLLIIPKIIIALLLALLFFDPAWAMTRQITEQLNFLLLQDHSSSMDVTDLEGKSRFERAQEMATDLEGMLPGGDIELESMIFEDDLFSGKEESENGEEERIRPTDLAQVLVDANQRQRAGDYDGIIYLTDGGDERFSPSEFPPIPLYFVGIGAGVGDNNDLEIHSVDVPSTVELETDFTVGVNLRAYGDTGFLRQLYDVSLELQIFNERRENGWESFETKRIDIRDSSAIVDFRVDAIDEEGHYKMRLIAEDMPDEMTYLNNKRYFTVNVEERSLRALLYSPMLGQNEAVLRRTLSEDAGIELTSLVRMRQDQYVIKSDGEEEAFLKDGFPTSVEDLGTFDTIIIGSFPARYWREEQMHALVEFVENGGSAVFLGGSDSFGLGGYYNTPLRPLFPWAIRPDEPSLSIGRISVTLTSAAIRQDVIEGWAGKMREAHPQYLQSLNHPGRLRRGAVSLLDAPHDRGDVAVLAIQPFGTGRVLGLATNTIWRWRMAGDEERRAYDHLWKRGIRYLAGKGEGGRFLRVNFDQDNYYPGERADIDIQIIGDYAEGRVSVNAVKQFEGEEEERLSTQRQPSGVNEFRSRTFFAQRGDYTFKINAFVDNEEIESFERTMWVGSRLNEGANIYPDHSFLRDLASRGGGNSYRENEVEELTEDLKEQLVSRSVHRTEPLIQYRGIYLILILLTLVAEWTVRRRLDLF